MPTVVDRFIQQAVLQVLQPKWDPTFSAHSYGFRPRRSALQAVAQRYTAQRPQESAQDVVGQELPVGHARGTGHKRRQRP